MVFGGVCPSVTSIIAESLQGWNLVQVRPGPPLVGGLSLATSLWQEASLPNMVPKLPSSGLPTGWLHSLLLPLLPGLTLWPVRALLTQWISKG